jgi:hypothetical protein
MERSRSVRNPVWIVLLSAVCMAGMWLYVQRVLVAYQIADAIAHDRPRGMLSDLYPRWLGARELLLHGRDPYSAAITREIQTGYYGRPIDSARPNDPKDQQAFAYPVYVAFYLAPLIGLPFDLVQKVFFWFLVVLAVALIPLCLSFLRWQLPMWTQANLALLMIGSLPMVQALKLQQMTIVVAALLAIALVALVRGHGTTAGVLLALATIKPQLVFILLLWLVIWTLADWKQRHRWFVSFLITMAILLGASQIWLPNWLFSFWNAMHAYQQYTGVEPALQRLIPLPWTWLPMAGTIVGLAWIAWLNRKSDADTASFISTTCAVLAVTLLVVPTIAIYNQVLLTPALLLLGREWSAIRAWGNSGRVWLGIVLVLLAWQWVSSTALVLTSFFASPTVVQKMWAVPGWTALMLPVAVAALTFIVAYRESCNPPASSIPA